MPSAVDKVTGRRAYALAHLAFGPVAAPVIGIFMLLTLPTTVSALVMRYCLS